MEGRLGSDSESLPVVLVELEEDWVEDMLGQPVVPVESSDGTGGFRQEGTSR
jgi:hypothetical protein